MKVTRVAAALVLVATLASAAPGTPFYPAGDRASRFQFHSPAAFGVIEESGLWLNFPGGFVHWGVEGGTPWTLHSDGAPTGKLRILKGGIDWSTPVYDALVAKEVREGVELRLGRTPDGLKTSFLLAPGVASVALFYEGVDRLQVEPLALRAISKVAEVSEDGLRCTQGGVEIECHYEALPRTDSRLRYRIVTTPIDAAQPVLVDPHVVWSLTGGGKKDETHPLISGFGTPPASQYVIVALETMSNAAAFPASSTYGSPGTGTDVLVVRQITTLSTAQDYTLIGGDGDDSPTAVTARAASVCIGGTTSSNPTTLNGPSTAKLGAALNSGTGKNVFVACVDATTVTNFILLGGTNADELFALTADPGGDVWLGGGSRSQDWPGCSGGTCNDQIGTQNAFIAHLTISNPTLTESELYPLSQTDTRITGLVLSSGRVFVVRQQFQSGTSGRYEVAERTARGVLGSNVMVDAPSNYVGDPVLLAGTEAGGLYAAANVAGMVDWAGRVTNLPVSSPSGFLAHFLVTGSGLVPDWGSYVSGTTGRALIRGLSLDRHGEPLLAGLGRGLAPLRTPAYSANLTTQKMFIQQSSSDGGLRYRFVWGGAQGNDEAWSTWQPDVQPTVPVVLSYYAAELEGLDDSYPGFTTAQHVAQDAGHEYLYGDWSMDETAPMTTLNGDAGLKFGDIPSFTFSTTEGSLTDSSLDELRVTLECPGTPQLISMKFPAGTTLSYPSSGTQPVSCSSSAPGYYRAQVWVVNSDGFDITKELLITVHEQDGGLPPVIIDAGAPDSGSENDAGVDAGELPDSGTDAGVVEEDGGEEPTEDGGGVIRHRSPAGCSCDATDAGTGALMLLIASALIGRKRRELPRD